MNYFFGWKKQEKQSLTERDGFLQAPDDEGTSNGFVIRGQRLPEDIVANILSHIPADRLLRMSLVCKSWCRIIRSSKLWSEIYRKTYNKDTKEYPWYIFYAVFTERLECNLYGQKHRKKISPYCVFTDEDNSFEKFANGIQSARHQFLFRLTNRYVYCHQHLQFASDNLLKYIVRKHRPSVHLGISISGSVREYLFYAFKCQSKFFLSTKQHSNAVDEDWKRLSLTISEYPVEKLEQISFATYFEVATLQNSVKLKDTVLKFLLDTIEDCERVEPMESEIDRTSWILGEPR